MDFVLDTIGQLNWWAIAIATLSTFFVGFFWYDLKVGFGKTWSKLNKLSAKDLESTDGMVPIFGTTLIVSFITVFLMACLIKATDVNGFGESLVFGIIFGLIFRGGAHFIHNGFAHRPWKLTLIDAGHDLVSLTLVALILGLWV